MSESDPKSADGADTTPRKGWQRRDWTVPFLRELRRTFNVRHSAKVAGIRRDNAYRRRNRDPIFAKRWDAAYEEGRKRSVLKLEQTFLDRAINGHKEDVWFDGVKVGTRRVHNVAREIYALKCLGGDRYKQDLIGSTVGQEFDDLARKLVDSARVIEAEASVTVTETPAAPELDGGSTPNP